MPDDNTPEKKESWVRRHRIVSTIGAVLIIVTIFSTLSGKESQDTATPPANTPVNNSKNEAVETVAETKKPDTPVEYLSALAQATSYANTMHMSKQGVYDQLVSEYGGKFTAAAAQYAIDNVKSDWNAGALASAKTYQDSMHMSPAAIYDQLVSEHGGQFTAEEASYAIAHLND